MENLAVWAEGSRKEKNVTYAFLYTVKDIANEAYIELAASNLYRLFVGDRLVGYGPARAAHGYARVDMWKIPATELPLHITVEVVAYNVNNYYFVEEDPFFCCRLFCDGNVVATSRDFICVRLSDRLQKVQRYSFQRPFVEDYNMSVCRTALYRREQIVFPQVKTQSVPCNRLIARGTAYPLFEQEKSGLCEYGTFRVDTTRNLWRDRSITDVGDDLGGFVYTDLEECISDEVSQFVYAVKKDISHLLKSGEYALFDFGKVLSGFVRLSVSVRKDCVLYLIFDEIATKNAGEVALEPINIDFSRCSCVNVVKWKLKKGVYELLTFEAYSLRFAKIVVAAGEIDIGALAFVRYENPTAYRLTFQTADADINTILAAAQNTYAQNSVDLLMDCPSRERAGWTNDGYFSYQADALFTGERRVGYSFLQNLIMAPHLADLPNGMTPMCYPCDHRDGMYVPNCGIWLALTLYRHYKCTGDESFLASCIPLLNGLLAFFAPYENEDELLENLEGWIFVEWSKANHGDYTCGVNYPSNMMYTALLHAAAEMLHEKAYAQKAERVRKKIIEQSFNGTFFEDNCVREDGKLVRKGHITEACQYYAFFFNIVTPQTHAELFRLLVESFGPERRQNSFPQIDRANVIIGLCMREDLLMRTGLQDYMLRECKQIFLYMAEQTQTLWEHVGSEASCNHGISAYCAVWILNALTGYEGEKNGKLCFGDRYIGMDCDIRIPFHGLIMHVTVRNGVRTIKQIESAN